MICPDPDTLVEQQIDKVLTQYRESPKLLNLLRSQLRQVTEVITSVCELPTFFDIDTAVGDQLTLIGKRLGWSRCHCVCEVQPIFGFDCAATPDVIQPTIGFCVDGASWADCGPFETSEVCITDDELYRKFLKVRRYQILKLYDIESLHLAIRIFWGEQAFVVSAKNRKVVIGPGRPLTNVENSLLQLYPRVLPIAPGVFTRFHFGSQKVFGFGEGWGGFCEPLYPNGTSLIDDSGVSLVDENGNDIITGVLTEGAPWTCPVDVKPYSC